MKISIASDHGGYALKEDLRSWLTEQGHEVEDFGCHGLESCDYADFCEPAARAAAGGRASARTTRGRASIRTPMPRGKTFRQ